ncbi:MAG TPA: FG-GAP-like repeat-containing protein, partial [Pyrinomonadaceae bacterium]
PTCNETLPCDDYTLSVDVPAAYDDAHFIKAQINWTIPAAQFDIFIYKLNPDNSLGPLIAANFFQVNPDVTTIPAVSGRYLLRVAPTIPLGDSINAAVTLEQKPPAATAATGAAPRYENFQAPGALGNSAGEPSIGVNLRTDKTLFQSNTTTLRVSFNDSLRPTTATWETKTAPNSRASLDPILFTDRYTGRAFVSQLAGGCSFAAYTDDDGDNWLPSQGCGVPAGVDHQTFGGGPLAAPLTRDPAGPIYPNGVYYCSQYGVNAASCAISLDGGLTFGPAVPIFELSCFGIHGHVKVAPDGTAYVPDSNCVGSGTARQGVVMSEDNGTTWSGPYIVPGSNPAPGIVDPSVAVGSNGSLYFGYANSNGAPSIAVGHKVNHAVVWGPSKDVGTSLGIKNITFPAVVAGDDARAAFAFLGTTTGGYYQDPANFQGVWHLYIATTYDGGNSWVTVDATPNDPVQRGSICNSGTVICSHTPDDRNLLDFMDATIDKEGRVVVGYADGCVTQACINGGANDFTRKGTIARQSGGRRLLAAFDPPPGAGPVADFDGDGRTDVSVYRLSDSYWHINNSATGESRNQQWGQGGDRLAPGDYDGDRKADIAVFRPSDGNWYIIQSASGGVSIKNWGGGNDVPIAADYDGDGKTDTAVFRASEGNWYIRNSSDGSTRVQGWGNPDDKLVPADYDGDGRTDIAVFRPSEGVWYIVQSSNGAALIQGWGIGGDRPVPGDYDGDGKSDIAVFRPSEGNWYIRQSSGSVVIKNWGDASDQPVAGDYDGDGRTDIAIFRPSESNWYIIRSSNGAVSLQNLGNGDDKPVPAAYISE